jgi:2'-5' RNA ligase
MDSITMSIDPVFVVTLEFDDATFRWLQALRRQHFPPARNFLPAHLTLLHAVSAAQLDRLQQGWLRFDRFAAPALRFTGIRSLGRGNAIAVDAPVLRAVRTQVMQVMAGEFSRQDLQPFKAHVTVQNKVDPAAARALLEQMSAEFVPRDGTGRGLMLWRYLGGPWSLEAVLPFGS